MSKFKLYYITYLLLVAVISGLLLIPAFMNQNEKSVKYSLKTLVAISARLVNEEDVKILYDQRSKSDYDQDAFDRVFNDLQFMKKSCPSLIGWIYLFYPANDYYAYMLVDDFDEDEERTFSKLFDVSDFEEMRVAIETRSLVVEEEINYDEEEDAWVISAYAPVFYEEEYVGHVGIDMFNREYNRKQIAAIHYSASYIILVMFAAGVAVPKILCWIWTLLRYCIQRRKGWKNILSKKNGTPKKE